MQCDLHAKIYKSHMRIARIESIEFQPQWRCSVGIVWIKVWKSETDLLCCLDECMEARLQLNTAWFRWNFQLPCECSSFNSSNSSRILQYLLQQIFNTSCRWWLAQEQAKGMMKFDEKKLKKFERIWENFRWKVFGSEIVKCWCRILLELRLYTLY